MCVCVSVCVSLRICNNSIIDVTLQATKYGSHMVAGLIPSNILEERSVIL